MIYNKGDFPEGKSKQGVVAKEQKALLRRSKNYQMPRRLSLFVVKHNGDVWNQR
jgi:hypothetical protein